jgi:uncharacterized membrane protein YsdA (DUF1294 family)
MLRQILAWWVAGASIVSFVAYGVDKAIAKAVAGGRRIPERVLHGIDIAGGSLGGLAARSIFRHKTAKPAFYMISWVILALQAAVFALVWR